MLCEIGQADKDKSLYNLTYMWNFKKNRIPRHREQISDCQRKGQDRAKWVKVVKGTNSQLCDALRVPGIAR